MARRCGARRRHRSRPLRRDRAACRAERHVHHRWLRRLHEDLRADRLSRLDRLGDGLQRARADRPLRIPRPHPARHDRHADRKSTRLNSSHTEIYTLSLHDALPISIGLVLSVGTERHVALNGMFITDGFAAFMKIFVLIGSAASIVLAMDYNERERIARFEFPLLILLATTGMQIGRAHV